MPDGWVDDPLAFVAIGEDGTVTIVCHRSEMGQGVRTGMPMIVADELEADWKRVRVAQAPGDPNRFGNQDPDGSRSTRHFFEPMRRCGAAARAMLETAAATRWNVAVGEVEARNHEVVHRQSGRRLGYGALAKDAAKLPVPPREPLRLKEPSRFRYIGKGELKLVDGPDIVSGKAQYGIDTRLPGMLRGDRAPAGLWGQGGQVRRLGGAQSAGSGPRGGNRAELAARGVQPAGRHRGDRSQHLGRDQGPASPQDRDRKSVVEGRRGGRGGRR